MTEFIITLKVLLATLAIMGCWVVAKMIKERRRKCRYQCVKFAGKYITVGHLSTNRQNVVEKN